MWCNYKSLSSNMPKVIFWYYNFSSARLLNSSEAAFVVLSKSCKYYVERLLYVGALAHQMWARPLYVGAPPSDGLLLKPKFLFSFFVLINYIGCLGLQIQIQHQCLDVGNFDQDGGNRRLFNTVCVSICKLFTYHSV